MLQKILIVLFVLGFNSLNTSAQTFDKTKLDAYFDTLANNNKFMGSVAISKNDTLLYTKSVGYTDIETKLKPNENTKYRIGSITKTFTAALIFKAIEENKISLDQTLDKFFPEIINASKITISLMLYHRSGIHNFTNDSAYLTWNTKKKSEAEIVAIISKSGSDFAPDSTAQYSNSNFVLLSYILEKLYNTSYANLLKEKIIQPLKLKNTYFGGKIDLKKNECNSYTIADEWKKESETDMSVPMGAGGIVSTPTDLTVFLIALLNGKIVSMPNVEKMKTIKEGLGMGIFQVPFNGQKGYGHNGGIDGFSSAAYYFPTDKISYAMTSNGNNFNTNDIAIAALSAANNKNFEIPSFTKFIVTSEELDKYLGVYACTLAPIKITVTKKGSSLMAQGTNQTAYVYESISKDIFKFSAANIVLEFQPVEKKLTLKQAGQSIPFTKE